MSKRKLGKVKSIVPVGNQVLIERLTVEEATGASTILSVNSSELSNQAIILDIGPMVPKDYGISVGDRVMLQGSFVPADLAGEHSNKNLVFPDMIKAILKD